MISVLGNVREEVLRVKSILLKSVGILTGGGDSPGLMQKVQLFLSSLEDVHIYAGSLVKCTHGLLLTYYGLVATYIAILHSSF